MQQKSTSPVKLKLIDFLRKTKDGEDYQFVLPGGKENADKFVHAMRVELSRLRTTARRVSNKQPKHFKMIVVSVEERKVKDTSLLNVLGTNSETVVRIQRGKRMVIDPELKDILDDLVL
jgi:hypothetical protein